MSLFCVLAEGLLMPESRTLDLAVVSETNSNVVTSTLDFEPVQGTAATTELQLTDGT